MPRVSTLPDDRFEYDARRRGFVHIAGVDEVGRGPLAGPVVVAAAILDPNATPQGLDDSKRLSAETRERLFNELLATARISVVAAPPRVIAAKNIRGATLWAMRQAVLFLPIPPDHVLVDGKDIPPNLPCSAEAVIGGDRRSVSIAAASIIAKVVRDRMCTLMDREEPQFGFAGHKAYPTPQHLEALEADGPGRYHRLDFKPVALARARLKGSG
jgi:ribonuclease HII